VDQTAPKNLERPKNDNQIPAKKNVSGWTIRSFHPLNYSLHVPWLFTFQHPEFSTTRGAGRDKVQFLMRRQHQMVAFAAPGHMVAESASIRRFALFPLDWDVFIESGHALPSGNAFYSRRPANQKKQSKALTTSLQQPLSYL
jgi:hypothetical protein